MKQIFFSFCTLPPVGSTWQQSANKSMAAPPLVFEFIGVVFTAILYGKYCLITLGPERQVNSSP